jgi:DNA repair protein RecO (recombination protein O)
VRRVPYGEADLVVTLFTRERGTVSALARAARKSVKRFSSLEPMHLLSVGLDERPGAELGTLVETALARPRLHLTAALDRLEAAGKALRWLRRAAPPHTPEPRLWHEINALLDDLDAETLPSPPAVLLAETGLRVLVALGWGLDFERCVGCGKPCDPSASACIDPARGGLVCRACGGARRIVRADRRTRLARAAGGQRGALDRSDEPVAIELVEATLSAHAGVEEI